MLFTKRHYIAIAATFRSMSTSISDYPGLVSAFADMFAQDNPQFDREKFLLACAYAARRQDREAVRA